MSDAVIEEKSVLAIHGGTPVRTTPMPVRKALDVQEYAAVESVFQYYQEQNQDPGYQGHFEDLYCNAITDFMGGGYADAVATGTASLYVALAALNLPKQSDVLVSPITDPGTLSAIILLGLRPKLIDAAPGSYNISFDEVQKRVDENTSCVLVVHAAGQGIADIAKIAQFCRDRRLKLLEDCSQAHGARVNGTLAGTFGDISAFSTMYRKASIMGPTGGFIYTQNQDYYHMALAHADRGKPRWIEGFNDRDPSQFLFPALNLHAGEIACAIGLASWSRLPETIKKRQEFLMALANQVNSQSKVCRGMAVDGSESPFYYPIFVNLDRIPVSKLEFAESLLKEGIPLNPHYRYVVEEWPWMKPYLADDFHCNNAINARDRSFCLYLNENYGESEVEHIVHAIQKVENYFTK